MRGHEEIRKLLALSAAGMLDAEEERAVREHAAECERCRAELEGFGELAQGLGALPGVYAPPGLATRTQAMAAAERDRRETVRGSIAAAVCGTALLGCTASVVDEWMGLRWALVWTAVTIVPSVFGGAAALVLMKEGGKR